MTMQVLGVFNDAAITVELIWRRMKREHEGYLFLCCCQVPEGAPAAIFWILKMETACFT
jgi:hypothetical protein